MIDNSVLTVDPDSLAFDVAPMAAAARTIVTSRDPLRNYVAVVRAISLGEQPIVIDGREAARYDVLAKKPELKSALWSRSLRSMENWNRC